MGDDNKEEPILRMGEWFGRHKWQYVSYVEVMIPACVSQGGTTTEIKFEKRSIPVISPDALETMLKDYDRYIDNNLVI